MNLSIVIGRESYHSSEDTNHIYSTLYNCWHSEFRLFLFPTLTYITSTLRCDLSSIPKWGAKNEVRIAEKLATFTGLSHSVGRQKIV